MTQPGEAFQPTPSAEDSFLDLLVETLEGLDEPTRAQFLRRFFRTIAQIDLSEGQSSEYWAKILQWRRELTAGVGRRVSLRTAMIDVLSSTSSLRVPILVEYDEFKKLQINAATDALTGLYNRRLFDEYLEKELNRAKRYGQQLAIAILDLHKLKEVNDRLGHLQGDHVLQIAATTLRTTLRASDFAFRIGGDEFALLLPETDAEQAITLCRRVRTEYENQLRPLKMGIDVTLDFGVAVHPQDGDQKAALLGVADERLYALKHAGRAPSATRPAEAPPSREPSVAPQPREAGGAPPPQVPRPSVVPPPLPEGRKWERVSLAGTKAHAVLAELGQRTARVIDLSYGGVALQLEGPNDFPAQFNAVLHVPILPPVRVVLRKVYSSRTEGGHLRIGCSFVS
ncbi:MAG TPA: GGDEF domain-containing protein [Candidatus Acidoferrales bacterium]|nr:GGDEF domain-containing protein [Candidatus Acidoferrales bacterium]